MVLSLHAQRHAARMTTTPESKEEQREAYLRWEPAKPDAGAFRGDKLDSLNAATLETIHEKANAENAAFTK